MKTIFFRIMPTAFAFILAITASFATHAKNRTKYDGPIQQGYIKTLNPMQPCQLSIKCDSSINGLICTTADETQVWGKATSGSTSCSVTLYGAEKQ